MRPFDRRLPRVDLVGVAAQRRLRRQKPRLGAQPGLLVLLVLLLLLLLLLLLVQPSRLLRKGRVRFALRGREGGGEEGFWYRARERKPRA